MYGLIGHLSPWVATYRQHTHLVIIMSFESEKSSNSSEQPADEWIVDVKELMPPKDGQDPRITRDPEHIEKLQNRFHRGLINTIMFTVDDHFIVDGNYRREVMIKLAEKNDDPSFRKVRVLGTKDELAYAVPVKDIDIEPEMASLELNLYRQNNSQADCAKFLRYLIKTRILEPNRYGVAGDTTAAQLIGQHEHAQDDSRPDEWQHSDEVQQLIVRFIEDLDFGSPESARTYLILIQNAKKSVKQAWSRDEIGRSHVEELNEITKYVDDGTLDTYLERTIEGELTRDKLRQIKQDLKASESGPGDGKPPETEDEPEAEPNLSEEQKKQVAFIVENRSLSREEYLKSLFETDDLANRLDQDEAQLKEVIEQTSPKPVEVRMQERQKMLKDFDFDSESKFATGNANHLAPPVETDNLGVFFHDCQQMDDELDDDIVNLVFTSPPYFTQRGRIVDEWCPTNERLTQDSVDTAYENYLVAMTNVIEKCDEKLAEGGHLLLNVSDYQVKEFQKVYDIPSDFSHRIRHAEGLNFEYISTITWDKDSKTSSRLANFRQSNNVADFRPAWQTERILVFRKGGKRKKQDYTIDRSDIKNDCSGFDPMADLWRAAPTTTRDADHESGFPKRLPYLAVKLFTYPGDTVIDPFGGFATTLRAVKSVNEEEPDAPSRTGFAWENFASESNEQQDYRKRIDDLLTGSLTQFRDDHQIVN